MFKIISPLFVDHEIKFVTSDNEGNTFLYLSHSDFTTRYILCIDTTGNLNWTLTLEDSNSNKCLVSCVVPLDNLLFIISTKNSFAGEMSGLNNIMGIDIPTGNIVYNNSYGYTNWYSTNFGFSLWKTSQRSYMVASIAVGSNNRGYII